MRRQRVLAGGQVVRSLSSRHQQSSDRGEGTDGRDGRETTTRAADDDDGEGRLLPLSRFLSVYVICVLSPYAPSSSLARSRDKWARAASQLTLDEEDEDGRVGAEGGGGGVEEANASLTLTTDIASWEDGADVEKATEITREAEEDREVEGEGDRRPEVEEAVKEEKLNWDTATGEEMEELKHRRMELDGRMCARSEEEEEERRWREKFIAARDDMVRGTKRWEE
jgi:hypothetical protein